MAQEANIVIRLSDGKAAGQTLKELRQDANRLTKEVNNLKPGTEAFVKKSADLQKVSGRMKDVRGQINGVTGANNMAVESFLQYVPFGPQLGMLARSFNTVTGSTKTFGLALKAIPILALIGVIATLVNWFMQSQEAMDALTSVTRPVVAIFQRLIGVGQQLMSGVFGKLKEAINDPIGALKELGQVLLDNVINRFKAFGVAGRAIMKILDGEFKEGFKELGNSVIQFNTGITDAIDKMADAGETMVGWAKEGIEVGTRLDELQKSIERTEINLTTARARLNKAYQEGKEAAQDLSLSEAERLKGAREAQDAQNKLLDMEQHFLDLKIEKMKIEHGLNDTSRADELELAKLEAERTEFAANAARRRASAKALENTVVKQIAAEQKKMDDEERKREEKRLEELEQKRLEDLEKETEFRRSIEDLTLAIMDEGLEKELAKMDLETQRKIEKLTGTETQIAEQKKLLLEKQGKEEEAIKQKYRDQDVQKEEERQEAIQEVIQMGVEAFNDSVDSTIALLAKDEESRKRNARLIKAIEKGRIAINLIAEIQNIWKWANASPLNALLPGAAQVIAVGKTIAAGLRAKGAIQKINTAKLGMGGILRGPRHSGGGIPGYIRSSGRPIEMEDHEIILTRNVGLSPMGRAMASQLNEAFGGKKFALGGPVNPFTSASSTGTRGSTTFSAADQTNAQRETEGLRDEIRMLRRDMNAWQRELKVINNLQETKEGLAVLNQLEEGSSI